jgi:hypothetical protein
MLCPATAQFPMAAEPHRFVPAIRDPKPRGLDAFECRESDPRSRWAGVLTLLPGRTIAEAGALDHPDRPAAWHQLRHCIGASGRELPTGRRPTRTRSLNAPPRSSGPKRAHTGSAHSSPDSLDPSNVRIARSRRGGPAVQPSRRPTGSPLGQPRALPSRPALSSHSGGLALSEGTPVSTGQTIEPRQPFGTGWRLRGWRK